MLLSKSIKRWEFALGKYFTIIFEIFFILLGSMVSVILGIFLFPTVNPSKVFFGEILFAFLWNYIFLVALVSIGYFFSSFLSSKKAFAFGIGVVIFLYAIGQFWQSLPENFQEIKRISIFFYSDMSNLLVNHVWNDVLLLILVLLGFSIVLTVLAVIIFNKRDIPV